MDDQLGKYEHRKRNEKLDLHFHIAKKETQPEQREPGSRAATGAAKDAHKML
jgi:hypothetical protein